MQQDDNTPSVAYTSARTVTGVGTGMFSGGMTGLILGGITGVAIAAIAMVTTAVGVNTAGGTGAMLLDIGGKLLGGAAMLGVPTGIAATGIGALAGGAAAYMKSREPIVRDRLSPEEERLEAFAKGIAFEKQVETLATAQAFSALQVEAEAHAPAGGKSFTERNPKRDAAITLKQRAGSFAQEYRNEKDTIKLELS